MGWEGIIPNGSSRGERYSGSQKHRRPEFPTGEVGRAQWLSTTGRMLFSARQLCAARPFPPQCPVKSARSQGLLGRRQGRREGGEAARLPCWQALEHTAANLPPPPRPASQPVCPLQKDAQGSTWTSGCFQALCNAESPCAHITSLGS